MLITFFGYICSCATGTSVLQYGGLSAFLETKVLNQSSGIFSNFCTENPPHRKAEKRCAKCAERTLHINRALHTSTRFAKCQPLREARGCCKKPYDKRYAKKNLKNEPKIRQF